MKVQGATEARSWRRKKRVQTRLFAIVKAEADPAEPREETGRRQWTKKNEKALGKDVKLSDVQKQGVDAQLCAC